MKLQKKIYSLLLLLGLKGFAAAQTVKVPAIQNNYRVQLNAVLNRISCGDINSFYNKLLTLKVMDSGKVSIVHIGDSHIQAGYITGEVRLMLQQLFGNAGRGLVFPYQLAKSNAPDDISSYSAVQWQYNRLVKNDAAVPCGIAGFGIQNNQYNATINISLKATETSNGTFNTLTLFTDDAPGNWLIKTGSNAVDTIHIGNTATALYLRLKLTEGSNAFSLSLLSPDTIHAFYGASLENGNAGVLYHSIGVNGARYDQYNNTPLFWKQLPALNADLYIISMGTNEAQANGFDEAAFISQVNIFLEKLHTVSPHAAVLITTAADSYKGKHSNKILQQLNTTLYKFCSQKHIGFWDLYRITNGYGAAYHWLKKGLMSNDRVHFKKEGYQLQGQLLATALLNAYNLYVSDN